MSVPLLSELREPPVAGRYYMVPVIDYTYMAIPGQWPTLGPAHHDRGDIGFEPIHFHVDFRFLTADQARRINRGSSFYRAESIVANYPLNHRNIEIPRRAYLAKRRCRVAGWKYTPPTPPRWMPAFNARYGKVAEPRRLADGRLLCPHRKVDLSTFVPDADGIVTCPLHGLRVRCGVPAHG